MKNKKIVIAGGTGFIGQEICNYFGEDNKIIILTRQLKNQQTNTFSKNHIKQEILKNIHFVKWDSINVGEWTKELEGADIVINLAGRTVNCRYNEKNKREIIDSRTNSVKAIGLAIQQATVPPKLWINAASATIYPEATDTPRDENFNDFENDFSVQVCKKWEETFYNQRTPFTRKVILRISIALGTDGAIVPYLNLLKFKLGGKQGSGKQMYSWIHIEDVCRMMEWIEEHKEIEGTYNCTSPGAVNNKEFMQTLRKATHHRIGLPAFKWMIQLGAKLIGTEPELVLKSRWVVPTKILQTGFQFKYPQLQNALKNIIDNIPRKQYHLF